MCMKHPEKTFRISILSVALGVVLSGCGGGGGTGQSDLTRSRTIEGSGVKGPLANAVVTVYQVDTTQPGFKGSVIATGTTDTHAAITGLNLPFPLSPPYIMELTSSAGSTYDITTHDFPVITTLRTVITQSLLDSGDQIYATPLTTLATDLAIRKADAVATVEAFKSSLQTAASEVASTVGFGIDDSVDIFATPPLIDSSTVTPEAQASTAAYRSAIEALTAITYEMSRMTSGVSADDVLADLAVDLADDGIIDASAGASLNADNLQVLEQDPAGLIIPGTTITVGNVEQVLISEKAETGITTNTDSLPDVNPQAAETNPDIDNDGVANVADAFPSNPAETTDSDGDGIGDVSDPDDNNDGILDVDEGINVTAVDNDDDSDGVTNASDNCPANFNPSQTDTDSDGQGDACDDDLDGDGVSNNADAFPMDSTASSDFDHDGIDDLMDDDDDNDGISDSDELAAGTNPKDRDSDDDGVFDASDAFPLDPNESRDSDGDGVGDNADNCPAIANTNQLDSNNDGTGDVCETATPAIWNNFTWNDGSTWQ